MSNGMTVTATEETTTEESDSTNHLKSVFDQSLAVLCEDKDSVRARSQTEWSRRGSLPLHVDAVNLQKRAFDNAAKALATTLEDPGSQARETAKPCDALQQVDF